MNDVLNIAFVSGGALIAIGLTALLVAVVRTVARRRAH